MVIGESRALFDVCGAVLLELIFEAVELFAFSAFIISCILDRIS